MLELESWYAVVVVFLFVWFGLALLVRHGLADRLAIDAPNERSLHTAPTPRIGGLLLVPAALAGWLLTDASLLLLALLGAALAMISYIDDRRHLPVALRFGAHVAAAGVAAAVLAPGAPWWGLMLLIVVTVWATNLYNFMDGSDGLAGGMALIGFGTLATAAHLNGAGALLAPTACIAAASLGFLFLNYPPAKVFMGDVGSIPLGFLAATLGLAGALDGVWPAWLPLIAFAPFIVDASLTLGRRALRGEKVWQAHREHAYQRMVRLGYGHAGTALRWYGIMLAGAVVALSSIGLSAPLQWSIALGWYAILSIMALVVEHLWHGAGGGSQTHG